MFLLAQIGATAHGGEITAQSMPPLTLKIKMKNETKPDSIGNLYYSAFFNAYISAEETSAYVEALPTEEQAAYAEALPLEAPFLGAIDGFK